MANSFEHNEKRITAYLSNSMPQNEKIIFEADLKSDKELSDLYDEISIQRYIALQSEYNHFLLYGEEEDIFEGEAEMNVFENRMESSKDLAEKYQFKINLQKVIEESYNKKEEARMEANIQAILDKKYPHLKKDISNELPKPTQTNYKPYLLLLVVCILPLAYYVLFYKPSHKNDSSKNVSKIDTHANEVAKIDSQIVSKGNEIPKESLKTVSNANEGQKVKTKIDSQMILIQKVNLKYDTIISKRQMVCWYIKEIKKYSEKKIGANSVNPDNETIKTCELETQKLISQKENWQKYTMNKKMSLLSSEISKIEIIEYEIQKLLVRKSNSYKEKKTDFENKNK